MEKITEIEKELDKLIFRFDNEKDITVKKTYKKEFVKILRALGILTENMWDNDKLAYSLDDAKTKAYKYLSMIVDENLTDSTIEPITNHLDNVEYNQKQSELKELIRKSREDVERLQKEKEEYENPKTKIGKFFKSIFG